MGGPKDGADASSAAIEGKYEARAARRVRTGLLMYSGD